MGNFAESLIFENLVKLKVPRGGGGGRTCIEKDEKRGTAGQITAGENLGTRATVNLLREFSNLLYVRKHDDKNSVYISILFMFFCLPIANYRASDLSLLLVIVMSILSYCCGLVMISHDLSPRVKKFYIIGLIGTYFVGPNSKTKHK